MHSPRRPIPGFAGPHDGEVSRVLSNQPRLVAPFYDGYILLVLGTVTYYSGSLVEVQLEVHKAMSVSEWIARGWSPADRNSTGRCAREEVEFVDASYAVGSGEGE